MNVVNKMNNLFVLIGRAKEQQFLGYGKTNLDIILSISETVDLIDKLHNFNKHYS